MKKWFVILLAAMMMVGCGSTENDTSTTEAVYAENRTESYGWCEMGYSPYSGGVLVKGDKLWVCDENSRQMLVLCSRAECDHENADCPAVYLGRYAYGVSIYEGKIWYVLENEEEWEFWTADLNGENQVLKQTADRGTFGVGAEHLYYKGHYYTVARDMIVNEETGEVNVGLFLVEVDLDDGSLTVMTDTVPVDASMTLEGACRDKLYYTVVETNAEGVLVRNICERSLKTEETTVLAQSGWCCMEGEWMAYRGTTADGQWEVLAHNVKTGEVYSVCQMAPGALQNISLSGGRLLVFSMEGEKPVISWCEVQSGFFEKLPSGELPYDYYVCTGKGWFLREPNPDPALAMSATDTYLYHYISHADLIAGKEPVQVR